MNGSSKLEDKKESPSATYKPIPKKEMEDDAVIRSKSGIKSKTKEVDGADEKMLSKDETKVSPNSEISLKDVKIVMGEKNGEAKVDTVEPKNTFGGMTKEELMKYANDPFWVRLRWFLFITFWLLWAAMLVGAIMIIYAAPKCDPPPPRTWWQVGPLAEIEPDTKPEELKSINKDIKGLIISWTEDAYKPFDESHDIIKLIKQSKELGTKIIVDLDPSTSQLWFEESEKNNGTFKDYYIWQPPKDKGEIREPPNNWVSLNNTSLWKFSDKRGQYFYAPFEYPHLNFRNQLVVKEFSDVMKKFVEHGASGIRIRNAPTLLVDPNFENEILFTMKAGVKIGEPGFFMSTKTMDLLELGKLLLNWKEVIRNKTEDGLLMVAEELRKVQSYQVNDSLVVDLPLMTNVFAKPDVSEIVKRLNQTFKIDNVKWPLWRENSSSLPADVVSIVTNLLPGASLVDFNATIDHQLLKVRESPSIMRGNCDMHAVANNTVFAFVRETIGNPGVLVVLNTADERVTLNVKQDIPSLPNLEEVTIQHYSRNYNETGFTDVNAKKNASSIPLSPKSVLVLQYVPKKRN